MNYIFNILWFEDNAGWYRLQKPKVEAVLAEHCLQCNIKPLRSSEVDINILKDTTYDLILMDYDLTSKNTGEHVISTIRDADILTDILFYSSQYDAMIGAVTAISPPLDGIYYSSRKIEVFHQKLKQLISKIVQRSEDLINLRGFVLENSCDFELRIRELLNLCWDKFTPEQQETLSASMIKQLDGKCTRINANVNKAKTEPCIYSAANNDEYLLSISDRLDILQVIIPILSSDYGMQLSPELKRFKDHYIKKVSMYRNRLGHVKLGEKVLHLEGKQIPIDQALHRLLRTNVCEIERTISFLESFILTSI